VLPHASIPRTLIKTQKGLWRIDIINMDIDMDMDMDLSTDGEYQRSGKYIRPSTKTAGDGRLLGSYCSGRTCNATPRHARAGTKQG
jgi:hypothetical protein